MKIAEIGTLSENRVFSEFYMALLGEKCLFTTPAQKTSDDDKEGFRIIDKQAERYLSHYVKSQLKNIVDLSSCVKNIELWKQKQIFTFANEMPQQSTSGQARNERILDTVKKAIVESIIVDYNAYLKSADQMRIEHLTQKRKNSIEELLIFVMEWYNRLSYLRSLHKQLDSHSGIEMMNLLFQEWTVLCMRDWSYGIVERALQKGSLVLQKICTNWLMEAQLPQNTQWFIKLQIGDAEASTRSRHSINSTLNCSLNSTTYSVLNNDLNSTFIISKRESDYSRRLVLPAVLDQDCAPSAFGGSNELLHIVHFLKVLRSQRSYAHQMNERRRLLDALSSRVWFIPSEKGKLLMAVRQVYAIICEDMMQELMGKQRLVDQLSLAHGYFFMLRGDLLAELGKRIFVKSAKNSQRYSTPFSCRKGISHASKIAEKYLSDALDDCSPPSQIADLKCLLAGEKLPSKKTKGKSFFEAFSLTLDTKQRSINDREMARCTAEFFSLDVLKVYKKIFSIGCSLQLQRAQLDYTWHNFVNCVHRRMAKHKEFQPFLRFIFGQLRCAQFFLSRLAIYLFEEVLLTESTSIFESIQRETNPHGLLYKHKPLLFGIMTALFIYQEKETSQVNEMNKSILDCIRKANPLVEAVNEFCEAMPIVEHLLLEEYDDEDRKLGQHDDNRCIECELDDVPAKRKKSNDEFMTRLLYEIQQSAKDFKESQLILGNMLEQYVDGRASTRRHSPYWSKLYSLLFVPEKIEQW